MGNERAINPVTRWPGIPVARPLLPPSLHVAGRWTQPQISASSQLSQESRS